MKMLLVLAAVLMGSSVGWAQSMPDSLSGDGLVVRFDTQSQTPRGTLELGGQSYPWTARVDGNRLVGSFSAGGKSFSFSLQQTAADQFTLESDGNRYTLRMNAAAPPAQEQPPRGQTPPPRGQTPPARNAVRPISLAFTPYTLSDPRTRLDVATMLIPAGWKVEPGVWWREKNAQFVTLATSVFDPQTGLAVRWIPYDQFSFNPVLHDNAVRQGAPPLSIGGFEYTREVLDARGYIEKIVLPRYRKLQGLKVTAAEDLPKLAEAIDRSQPFTRQLYQAGGRQLIYSAARVRIEYPGQNNTQWEEEILCVLNISWSPTEEANARAIGWPGERFFLPDRCYSFTAPKGQLDAAIPTLQTVPLSMRATRDWTKFCDNINQLIGKIALDQYAMEKAARAEITESQKRSVEEASKAAERQSDEVGYLLNNSRAWKNGSNPNSPTHTAPGGMRPWQNGKGEIHNFPDNENPNDRPGSTKDWTPLQPAGPKG